MRDIYSGTNMGEGAMLDSLIIGKYKLKDCCIKSTPGDILYKN